MTTWQPLKSYFQDWKEGKSWKPDNPLKSSKMETRERIKTWQPPRPLSAPLQTFLLQLLPPPDQCIWWQMQDSKNPQIIGKHWTPRICHFFLLLRRNTSSLQQKATKKSPHVPHLLVRLLWWLSRPQCQRRWWRWTRRQGWGERRWGWWAGGWEGELRGRRSSSQVRGRSNHPPLPSTLLQAPQVAWMDSYKRFWIQECFTCFSTWDCWRVEFCTLGTLWELGCPCTPRRLCDPHDTGNGEAISQWRGNNWTLVIKKVNCHLVNFLGWPSQLKADRTLQKIPVEKLLKGKWKVCDCDV